MVYRPGNIWNILTGLTVRTIEMYVSVFLSINLFSIWCLNTVSLKIILYYRSPFWEPVHKYNCYHLFLNHTNVWLLFLKITLVKLKIFDVLSIGITSYFFSSKSSKSLVFSVVFCRSFVLFRYVIALPVLFRFLITTLISSIFSFMKFRSFFDKAKSQS